MPVAASRSGNLRRHACHRRQIELEEAVEAGAASAEGEARVAGAEEEAGEAGAEWGGERGARKEEACAER